MPSLYYANYLDVNLDHNFSSCVLTPNKKNMMKIYLNQELWAPGQPDNLRGDQTCVGVDICPDCLTAGLQDVACTSSFKFLCQVVTNHKI